MIARTFGIKGLMIAVVLVVIGWKLRLVDVNMLLGGGVSSPAVPAQVSKEEQEQFDFVKVVLKDTEGVWASEFNRIGKTYSLPSMVVYRGKVQTGCGVGSADMGPFYCPADRKIYIDLSFYDELARTFQSPGDFAQAYVVAHEVGHHVQKLLVISDKVYALRNQPNYNE